MDMGDTSAIPHLEMPKQRLTNMDPSLYAVFEECRYKSHIAICHLSRIIDIAMCGFEESSEVAASETLEDASCPDGALHRTASAKRQGIARQSGADAVISTNDTAESPFIPFVGENPNGSVFSMLHFDPECSSSISGLGCFSDSAAWWRSRPGTGKKTISTTAPGNWERDASLFPNLNGHWECGIFSGKRVYIDTGGSYIGRGATAMVYEGYMVVTEMVDGREVCLTKVPVAIKEITFNAKERRVRSLYELAVNMRLCMAHPGLVHSYYAGTYLPRIATFRGADKAMLYGHLVLARSVTGSVADVLKRIGSFPESEIKRCMGEMLSALQCIHEDHHCVHNDVKPHNILIFDDPDMYYADVKYQITDLSGIALAKPIEEVLRDLAGNAKRPHSGFLAGGTAMYMSPESCLGLGTLTSNDVWSLGITAFHMATGTLPWRPLERQYPSMVLNGYRQKFTLTSLLELDVYESREACGTCTTETDAPQRADSGDTSPATYALGSTAESEAMGSSSNANQAFCDAHKEFGPILDALDEVRVSSEFRSFLAQCLIENPIKRPTCGQLRSHPFVKDVNVSAAHH
ncbi:hypothetical protein JKF63_07006 [Porcisia hertigi]|uniref:Protein kinase domain-containing protein n=1 Tax=Porcisia hertigi TaxID=2761500 RepID=A0A836LHD6_9TRYP|nr:hypothetical protein JKF63_07006 [Porcisia hertigi]